jgi:hypothetical protein
MVLIEDLSEELPQDVEIAHVLAQALTLKDQGNAAFKAKEWEQVHFCDCTSIFINFYGLAFLSSYIVDGFHAYRLTIGCRCF